MCLCPQIPYYSSGIGDESRTLINALVKIADNVCQKFSTLSSVKTGQKKREIQGNYSLEESSLYNERFYKVW